MRRSKQLVERTMTSGGHVSASIEIPGPSEVTYMQRRVPSDATRLTGNLRDVFENGQRVKRR